MDLEISPGGDPKLIVERAVEVKRDAQRKAVRQKDDYLNYDQIWCVFDEDEHERLNDALQQARDNEISVALSNPCFELWALLHFQEQTSHIDRAEVRRLCRTHMPRYDKQLPCKTLLERSFAAAARAANLDKWHEARGTPAGNPSTGVYRLVSQIVSQTRN